MPPSAAAQTPQFNPAAAVLGWLWPGLGHISIGERRRGRLIMLGVLFLFVGGVLIGGVDCVKIMQHEAAAAPGRSRQFVLWFLAQGFCGPIAVVVDWINPHYPANLPVDWQERYFDEDPEILAKLRVIGLNKPNEMGTLFCALAGLMNLVAILDVLYFAPKGPREFVERRRTGGPGTESSGGS